MPPFLILPSYRFASYSGIPTTIRLTAIPPTTPPAPTPARAARIGPAAIKGPIPGTAIAPIPASQPKTPPITAPVPAPAEAPRELSSLFHGQSLLCLHYQDRESKYLHDENLPREEPRVLLPKPRGWDKFQTQPCFYLP